MKLRTIYRKYMEKENKVPANLVEISKPLSPLLFEETIQPLHAALLRFLKNHEAIPNILIRK